MIYAQETLMPWATAALRDLGAELFDVHVHVGIHDPAGLEVVAGEALGALEQVDSGALVFALKEPEGYRTYNRQMIDLAATRPDHLRALCRLDPADEPVAELERCLEAGAVGIKLHPRGEGFAVSDERLDRVFAIADERRLPIMIHAGVGDMEIGVDAVKRAEDHPGARFILAHCATGAFEQVVGPAQELPNLFFDTSWWNPADVWALFRTVPPSQILYASDIPFGSPALAIITTARLGRQAGLNDEQLRSVLGGQARRLIDGADPLDVGPLQEPNVPLEPELERLYVTLSTCVEPMLRGRDPGQGLELAEVACRSPSGPRAELVRSIGKLLELSREAEDPDPLRPLRKPGFDIVLSAAILARTPRAPLPKN